MPALIVLAILLSSLTIPTQAVQQPPGSVVQPPVERPWPPAGVYRLSGEIVSPKLVKDVKPKYTAAAMRKRIEGMVHLEAVIEADGTVGEVRVKQSLDREFGLDEEAVRALKLWSFTPARKGDVAVPVLVEVEMTFVLRSRR